MEGKTELMRAEFEKWARPRFDSLEPDDNPFLDQSWIAWQAACAAPAPPVKRAYHETHEPPHCPTCGCASPPSAQADALDAARYRWLRIDEARAALAKAQGGAAVTTDAAILAQSQTEGKP